ncbi:MAG: ABC transporter ATP-binding protein [Alteraurantiacibacter sp.]
MGRLSRPAASGGGLTALLAAIRGSVGARQWPVLGIVVLAAALESVGLVLVLPVAETLFAAEGAVPDGITGRVVGWLGALGIRSTAGHLAAIGAVFIVLTVLRALVLLKRDTMMAELAQGFVDRTRADFFGLLAATDWPVIKRLRKAHLLDAMTTNIARLAGAMHALTSGAVTVAMAVAFLVAGFVVSTLLGFALLVLVALGVVFALAWSARSRALGERMNWANRGVMAETTRFLEGMKAAKAANAEDALAERFVDRITETRTLSVQFVRQQGRLRNGVQIVASLAAFAVLLVGYGWLGMSGGELLVMAAIVLRLAPSAVAAFGNMQMVALALPAFDAIRALEGELLAARSVPAKATAQVPDLAGIALVLDGASVRVAGENGSDKTLVTIDRLHIAPGTLVHIGGPSGAGKSSLAELVAGLHLPASGTVMRGEVLLGAETRRTWQAQLAFAPQEPFLFDATVRENLLWPNCSADDEAIWHALEVCEAADLVNTLPNNLDEELLDGGARLSGGERQRLCLARALLRGADLLILDEATSAMDAGLERRIVGRLRADIGQRIVLLVSHSLNAIDQADMRVVVENGIARLAS